MIYRTVISQTAFLLVLLIKSSKSCECDMKHPQQHFCDSDFVIDNILHGLKHLKDLDSACDQFWIPKILGNSEVSLQADWILMTDIYEIEVIIASVRERSIQMVDGRNKSNSSLGFEKYRIKVNRIFKRSHKCKKIKRIDRSYIYTPLRVHDCGVRLCKDKRYILTGHVNKNHLWVTSCDWVQDIHKVTRRERRGLRNYYKRSCDCQIKRCSGHKCGRLSANECGMYTMVWSCYTRYGACMRRKYGKYAGKCMWKPNWYFHKCMEDHFYHHSRAHKIKHRFSVVNVKKHKTRKRHGNK